jgi:ubiquinone/menaquinone biosynthesis C-methylase UbiE
VQLSKSEPIGAGKSSFDLIDTDVLFGELKLAAGMKILDLACGTGAYSLKMSEKVGAGGVVYAVDLWQDGIARLKQKAESGGIQNIIAVVGNAGDHIPVGDESIDLCLMSTVLHDFVLEGNVERVMTETVRILKPGAILAINEFEKIEGPPGPPLTSRLSPDEVEKIVSEFNFKIINRAGIGPYNYLMRFELPG